MSFQASAFQISAFQVSDVVATDVLSLPVNCVLMGQQLYEKTGKTVEFTPMRLRERPILSSYKGRD